MTLEEYTQRRKMIEKEIADAKKAGITLRYIGSAMDPIGYCQGAESVPLINIDGNVYMEVRK